MAMPVAAEGRAARRRPLVWAHRGASSAAPENTLAAFRKGLEVGADGVELDVHLTLDGHVVVIHDPSVNRTTNGRGRVADLSLAAIQALDAGGRFSPEFAGERVPTLEEVLAVVMDWPCDRRVLIELKGPFSGLPSLVSRFVTQAPYYPRLPAAVVKLLEPYKGQVAEGRILAQSFYKPYLDELRAMLPDLTLLYLACPLFLERERVMDSNLALDGVAVMHASLSEVSVAKLRQRHRHIFAWTVDSELDLVRLLGLGVDGLISNCPALAVELVSSGCAGECGSQPLPTWRVCCCHHRDTKHTATKLTGRAKQA